MTKTCKVCNTSFETQRNRETCSDRCRKAASRTGTKCDVTPVTPNGDEKGRPLCDPLWDDVDRYRVSIYAPGVSCNFGWAAEINYAFLPTGYNKRSWSTQGDTARQVALAAVEHAKYAWRASGETPCWWDEA